MLIILFSHLELLQTTLMQPLARRKLLSFALGLEYTSKTGTVTFKTIAHIRAWDFNANPNVYLNDNKAGGNTPFMGQATSGKSWGRLGIIS